MAGNGLLEPCIPCTSQFEEEFELTCGWLNAIQLANKITLYLEQGRVLLMHKYGTVVWDVKVDRGWWTCMMSGEEES